MNKNKDSIDESPPFLKKWSRVYWVVMINLVFWLLVFFVFRRIFE